MHTLLFPRHLILVLAGTLTSVMASQTNTAPAMAKPLTVQASVVKSNVVYRSVFVVPTNAKQGRDPFFPESQRFVGTSSTTNASSHPIASMSPAALLLQGISGSADRRLAIINGRTLAEGEEADVDVSGTRIHFRCVEIKADAVVVEIGSERRELRMRGSF